MFKAAFSTFSGGSGSGGENLGSIDFSGGVFGLGGLSQQINQRRQNSQAAAELAHRTANGSEATSQVVSAEGIAPQVPMAPSYNEAAKSPVFSPADQESVGSVFGTSDQRQAAVTGSKQDTKDKIISELNNL